MSADYASKSLQKMAGLGTDGKHESSIKRDLIIMLGEPNFCEPHVQMTPMKVLKPKAEDVAEIQDVEFPIWLPHKYLAWLYANHSGVFKELFLDGDESCGSLEDFWSETISRRDPRLEGHDFSKREGNWKRCGVPISLHADAVPCIGIGKPHTRSYPVYSMQGEQKLGLSWYTPCRGEKN